MATRFAYIWNSVLQIQYWIFLVAALIRMTKHWHAGQFNPKFMPRSGSYIAKIVL